MLDRVKDILAEYVGLSKEQITPETNLLEDLQLSSLDVVNIIVAFEEEFDIEIPNRDIRSIKDVPSAIRVIRRQMGE